MLQVSKMLSQNQKSFFKRLNANASTEDAVTNNVLYCKQCWVNAKKKAMPKSFRN